MSDNAAAPAAVDDGDAGSETRAPIRRKYTRRIGGPAESDTAPKPEVAAQAASEEGDAPTRRKRALKPEKIDAMAQRVFAAHHVVAALTGQPALQISPDEAKALATAGLEVMREFDFEIVSGKTAALIGMAGTAAMIYVPRILHIQREKAARIAASKVAQPPDPVPDAPFQHAAPIVDPPRTVQ